MDLFITFCRAIAALLITNAHYQHVYPLQILASGGLLGDVLFFAVSGYCIYNLKHPFGKWYGRRLLRIYPAVWLSSLAFVLMRFYNVEDVRGVVDIFLYPTRYHFVASIIVLYVVYYICLSMEGCRRNLPYVMLAIGACFLVYYVLGYDKSKYRIDNVRSWDIRILFFEAMLLGAYFRQKRDAWLNRRRKWSAPVVAATLVCYALSKWLFSRYPVLAPLQILNWFVLLSALTAILFMMIGLENTLRRLPGWVLSVFTYISTITLEVYLVQYELIPRLDRCMLFPLNFLVVTVTVGVSASLLHAAVVGVPRYFSWRNRPPGGEKQTLN